MCDMYCYSAGYDVVSYHSFFFFKQKTAYEVRISDWSSDVCSSDLPASHLPATRHGLSTLPTNPASFSMRAFCSRRNSQDWGTISSCRAPTALRRSEEHTSELQSLMRISYAVFCLKKKKTKKHHNTYKSRNSRLIHNLKQSII